MVQYYNLTNITSSSGFAELAVNLDNQLGGLYIGWSILFMVGIVCFMVLKVKGIGTAGAFSATTWLLMFVAWFLRVMGVINNTTLWGCVILMIGSVLLLFLSDN